jgi:EAL domain-containing protein (putative c-di-GMP-specific phosphodiesterase class I)
MNTPPRGTTRRCTKRDSGGHPVAPQGRLYLWCPSAQTQAKIVAKLHALGLEYELAEGECVILDLEWGTMRDLVIPVRRLLTHRESEDVKVLYRAAGGALTTADFPKVQSYAQFSLVSQSAWLGEMLDEKRYTSVLQPIVYAAEPHRVFAREALFRGFGKDDAIVYPNYLFAVARGCGMLVQLDLAARRAAIDRMLQDQITDRLFLNLTPSAIDDPLSTLESTVRMIDDAGVGHERIVFEVVESEKLHDIRRLEELLRFYRDAGFRVALDDVGAGYSSLNLLHQLRPDFVKLDMDLIRGVEQNPYKALIAEKIIEIATALGVETIAEGVETAEELRWVQQHGATYAQGFAIARPSVPTLRGRTPEEQPRFIA